ncbi:MAG: glutaredoxin domain-containing protein [Candidatus Poseidoniia archaeon]|jgi:mycoredoxin|nr:glutaredoxin domain-containing protein [Candidatus Poseidoniia archaeon]MDP7082393.1 glutaredoxin domain-containing protein [Candidatus Poseidoniia archaeon]MDP7255915.1 glutaredoxin domain-containing protein [Candidatus Poseidoniia archaeon]MDP7473778.1 glutaredoxin domain-containing protein [Candidatus Poseidoniia archaeon]MDP7538342.1 glutaredoxin domain-containing protein [Candidatus Poseidoniia archaeon]|tara:strand:+ start:757 stop:993 length:237 start_codon:yes stop_codon:yes gene_type:complete
MTLRMYGTAWCGDCHRAKAWLDGANISYEFLDIESDDALRDRAVALNDGFQRVPVLEFDDGSVLVEPTNEQLAAKLVS